MTEPSTPEDRYEALELIVKCREDGESWFDIIQELISKDCQGSEDDPCTCGLESLGGCSGTLDECYRWTGTADDLVDRVRKVDLLLVLDYLRLTQYDLNDAVSEAAERLLKECTWWDDFKASWDEEEEEEEEAAFPFGSSALIMEGIENDETEL